MFLVIRRMFITQQNAYILNRVYNNTKSFTNCVRNLHILQNEHLPLVGLCRLNALQTVYSSKCDSFNHVACTPIRFKSSKKNSKRNRTDDGVGEKEEEDSDDERSNLDEFRQGDTVSDRNLTEVKVQTLRLDTVIKAGLGLSKR